MLNRSQRADAPLQPGAVGEQNGANWGREYLGLCGRAHQAFAAEAKRLAAAKQSGRRMAPLVRDFLRNPQVRLSAALRALGGTPHLTVAWKVAERANPWAQGWPVVRWYAKPKRSGGSRPICVLPPELKAAHHMLAAAIAAQLVPEPTLFGIPGASRDGAAHALKALQNAGFVHLAKTDIVDCFQSVHPDALFQLPLPKEVIRRALDPRNLTLKRWETESTTRGMTGRTSGENHSRGLHSSSYTLHNPSGPRGLMQGSPASSIALAWLLNGLPQREDVRVLLAFDNLVIAARNPAGSREMADTLADHFRRCPAGPLALCAPIFADNEPLDFLGYRFDPARDDLTIGEDSLETFEARLSSADEADCLAGGAYPRRVWREITAFANGFPAVENKSAALAYYVETTRDAAAAGGDPLAVLLHDHLFAGRETLAGQVLRALLKPQSTRGLNA